MEVSPYKNKIVRKFYVYFANESIRDSTYADIIISPSYYTKKEIVELLRVSSDKVKVIPYGLDHHLFRPRDKEKARKVLGLPLNKKLVLNVANEEDPRKNIRTLILAFSKLRKKLSDVILVRVGRKSRHIQDLIAKLNLQEYVLNVGEVSADEIKYFYNACDIFVFPSLYEGFGIPLLEALASGCPVIASNVTSIPEVVNDAGILLNPLDVDGFASAMFELLNDSRTRSELVERGLARSMLFDWARCARETIHVYKQLLAKN
jgi:glycosyltransferase involved in cell wall biosynthesis